MVGICHEAYRPADHILGMEAPAPPCNGSLFGKALEGASFHEDQSSFLRIEQREWVALSV